MDDKKSNSFSTLTDILDYIESSVLIPTQSYAIYNSFLKAGNIINRYQHPCCAISGGKDSDIMIDLITKVDTKQRVKYVFFDTGIEYKATKEHLDYLENKYGIQIHREKAVKPIPISCKEYGQPFLSKYVSEMIMRLQKHNFQWEDDTYENLIQKYPKCQIALKWWTNHQDREDGSRFGIDRNKYLKEFIIQNPPQFKISNKCCYYSKKKPSNDFINKEQCDLMIVGVRQAEGGIRATAYKNCFTNNDGDDNGKISQYRPLFWYCEPDERLYDSLFGIKHSDCYELYGLTRTGCVGCPYGKNLEFELEMMEYFEPKLAKAVKSVFADSYEYTKLYREFCKQNKNTEG